MEGADNGIALRVIPYSDTSLIVHWLTWNHGRLATIAKGARRPRSPLFGRIDLFLRADLTFRHSRRSTLHTLTELNVTTRLSRFRDDIDSVRLGAYWTKLIERLTEPDTPLDDVASLYWEALQTIDRLGPSPRLQYLFETQLLFQLGHYAPAHDAEVSVSARPWLALIIEEPNHHSLEIAWPEPFERELKARIGRVISETAPELLATRDDLHRRWIKRRAPENSG